MKLIKWCTEKGKYINRDDCVDVLDGCDCNCYDAKGIFRGDKLLAVFSIDRCYPEDEGPVSYITIRGDEVDMLPDLVRNIKGGNPNEDIIVIIERSMDYLTETANGNG